MSLDADVVSYTNYDGGQAVSSSLRIALRVMEGRGTPKTMLLVPSTMNPEIYSQADAYCRNLAQVQKVAYEPETGLMDLADLEEKLRRTLPIWAFLRPGDRRSRIWPTGTEPFVSPSRKWRLLGSWRAP